MMWDNWVEQWIQVPNNMENNQFIKNIVQTPEKEVYVSLENQLA